MSEMCVEVLHAINNLISEISIEHILYKKCDVVAPNTIDDASRRNFLLEESTKLNKPPALPTVDCLTYGYYLAYFWMNNNMTRKALGIKEFHLHGCEIHTMQKFANSGRSKRGVTGLKGEDWEQPVSGYNAT